MTAADALTIPRLEFDAMVGTGGIGSGLFFRLEGNHTLGREESRMGRFLEREDYCKLHIVSHYVQVLLGPRFRCIPVGKVGADAAGSRLLSEMRAAGMDTQHVQTVTGGQTMFCICLIYPDESGGNLTVSDSASADVGSADIDQVTPVMREYGQRGLALALPEVPLVARRRLLEEAGRHGLFRAASFTSAEVAEARRTGMLAMADLLAINRDEAAALTGALPTESADAVAKEAIAVLAACCAEMLVSITAGRDGSWAWDGKTLTHQPSHDVEVASTAGAGDAHFAGILSGLAAGLSLAHAQELATLVAALSVTSPHTLHKGLGRASLQAFANALGVRLSPPVAGLLEPRPDARPGIRSEALSRSGQQSNRGA